MSLSCMLISARRATRYSRLCALLCVLPACRSATQLERQAGATFAELRLIKGEARIVRADDAVRVPYPRERLAQGQSVVLDAGALAWMRRDGGATWLVAGPAELQLDATTMTVKRGRFFADIEHGDPVTLNTPRGFVTLASARANIDVSPDGTVQAYALRGETRFGADGYLMPGEELTWRADEEPTVAPALTWTDWTGGLAVTDNTATPAPFGIGTVGARTPGQDGTPRFPLAIQRMDVKVTIEGDFALTEVDQTFVNPTTENVEGLFSFRTPLGAMLQRFGVDRDFGLVWGRIKERAAAKEQYESNVHQGSTEEPALLTWQGAGTYAARLYPIPPRSKRRVVTRYSEWLPRNGKRGERRLYVYPMAAQGAKASLPVIEELSVNIDLSASGATSVRVGSGAKVEDNHVVLRAADVVPQADFALELFDSGRDGVVAYQAPHNLLPQELPPGTHAASTADLARQEPNYVAFPIRIPRRTSVAGEEGQPEGALNETGVDLAIVVDTSAATEPSALVLARGLASSLLKHLGAGDRAALWTGDATLHPVAPTAGELTRVEPDVEQEWLAGLANAQLGGATDLGALLQAAAGKLDPRRRGAVVYIGDGAPSVGERVPQALAERLARMPTGTRIFAAALGSEPNLAVLEAVTRGGGVYAVHDGQTAGSAALAILESAQRYTWLDSQLDLGPGIDRIFPRRLPPLAEDSTLVVVGRLTGALPSRITLTGSGGWVELPVEARVFDDRGDLRRRWGHARVSELAAAGGGRAELVDVALRSGIVTPVTSLYVATRREEASEAASDIQRENDYAARRAKERRWQPWRSGGLTDELAEDFTRRKAAPVAASSQVEASAMDTKEGGSGAGSRPGSARAPKSGVTQPSSPPDPLMWTRESSTLDEQHGLRLSGNGLGGSASGIGIGLGSIGTLGSGTGSSNGRGRLGGSHATSGPRIRQAAVTVRGGLAKEVVQRISRQNFGRFRHCYANGLRRSADLAGTVEIRFSLDANGNVRSSAASAESTLPDTEVRQCISDAFHLLTFPPPDSGSAAVTYVLSLGDAVASLKDRRAVMGSDGSLGAVGHTPMPCGPGAQLPFEERVALWRERVRKPTSVSYSIDTYNRALRACEAPSFQERTRLLVVLVNQLASVRDRVSLWRRFLELSPRAADVVYRSLLLRVQNASDLKELHSALGLTQVEPALLDRLIGQATDPAHKLRLLRGTAAQFPDDAGLALRVLDAYEDAGDEAGGRSWARLLRRRADATSHLRMQVGEYYMRLASRQVTPQAQAADTAEARRTFGELVEFAPNDPLSRRQLGDLLRAHGWFEEAARQYETLLALTPDDPVVPLLLAATAAGTGKTQEAITWLEKANAATSAEASSPLFVASRALASEYLAQARSALVNGAANAKTKAADPTALERLRVRARRWLMAPSPDLRLIVTWAHPELHPRLFTDQSGSLLLAPDNHPLLGVAQGYMSQQAPRFSIRLDPEDAARAARLGLSARVTAIANEGEPNEKIASLEIAFGGGVKLPRETFDYQWRDGNLVEVTP